MAVRTGCLAVKTPLQPGEADHLRSIDTFVSVKWYPAAKNSRVLCLLRVQSLVSSSGHANDMHEKKGP